MSAITEAAYRAAEREWEKFSDAHDCDPSEWVARIQTGDLHGACWSAWVCAAGAHEDAARETAAAFSTAYLSGAPVERIVREGCPVPLFVDGAA